MRKINKTEVRLLIIFGGSLFLMANLFLIRQGLHLASSDREELALLRTKLERYQAMQAQTGYWATRSEWRKTHPLPIYDPARSDSAFVEQVQQSLTGAGLRIEEQQLKPPTREGTLVVIALGLKITGELENLIRWMAESQKAGQYTGISELTLKTTKDASAMVATLELSRLFVPPGGQAAR